jgi:hypothetical protein
LAQSKNNKKNPAGCRQFPSYINTKRDIVCLPNCRRCPPRHYLLGLYYSRSTSILVRKIKKNGLYTHVNVGYTIPAEWWSDISSMSGRWKRGGREARHRPRRPIFFG